jgi:hypothetical protein
MGLIRVRDLETGDYKWVDSSSKLVRYHYEKDFFHLTDWSDAAFKKAGSKLLHVRTDEDYIKVLQKFFKSRT